MGLLSFLKRKENPVREAVLDSADAVQRARIRARQRLIGAAVLLGIGLVAFPLLFETQPRPIPVDLPIEIPRKEGASPLALPAPRAQAPASPARADGEVITERAADAGKDVAPKPSAPPPLAEAKPPAPADDGVRAKALLDGPVAGGDVAQARFIVQVGAFADPNAARDTRLRVEKLGLKTYTQVIDTESGKRTRVRVGPFGSRDEADKAAGKIKSAGLQTSILAL
jgi:DedD protein